MYLCMCMCVYVHVCVCVCVCLCVCVCVHVCMCVYMYVYMCICMFVYMYVCVCVYQCMCQCMCVCVCILVKCNVPTTCVEDLAERIVNINNYFTFSLYSNVCRSLFEKHKLLFSFLVCVRILMNENKIDMVRISKWPFINMMVN